MIYKQQKILERKNKNSKNKYFHPDIYTFKKVVGKVLGILIHKETIINHHTKKRNTFQDQRKWIKIKGKGGGKKKKTEKTTVGEENDI